MIHHTKEWITDRYNELDHRNGERMFRIGDQPTQAAIALGIIVAKGQCNQVIHGCTYTGREGCPVNIFNEEMGIFCEGGIDGQEEIVRRCRAFLMGCSERTD